MTYDDFKEEVIRAGLGIANIDTFLSEFQSYQLLALKTLHEFHRICETHNINYQLAYGSLLGAVRDNGQIPWDYDIDVFVPYNQKNKLINTLEKNLGNDFYYVSPENDPRCCRSILRVAPKGYNSDLLHVDVFYLAGVPSESKEIDAFRNELTQIQRYRYARFINPFKMSRGSLRGFLSLALLKTKYYKFNWGKYRTRYNYLCSKYPIENSSYLVDTGVGANQYIFSKDDMIKTVLFKTRDGMLRIPCGYHNVLSILYGDYMKYPSFDSRLKEFLSNYKALKKYGYYGG